MSDDRTRTLSLAVESIIFAAETPVSTDAIVRTFGEVTGSEVANTDVEGTIAQLNALYEERGRAFRIHNWGGGYRMATIESVAGFVKAHLNQEEERRLSRALLETLSVIAYKQPVSKPEVDHVRGVQSDYAVRQLLERDFISVVGRSESVGRPLLYGTTQHFLDQFGLGQLDDLPRPREIDELLNDPAFSHERALLTAQMEPEDEEPEAVAEEAEPPTEQAPVAANGIESDG